MEASYLGHEFGAGDQNGVSNSKRVVIQIELLIYSYNRRTIIYAWDPCKQ